MTNPERYVLPDGSITDNPMVAAAAALEFRRKHADAYMARLMDAAEHVSDLMRISELYNAAAGYGDLIAMIYETDPRLVEWGGRIRKAAEGIRDNQQEAFSLLQAALYNTVRTDQDQLPLADPEVDSL